MVFKYYNIYDTKVKKSIFHTNVLEKARIKIEANFYHKIFIKNIDIFSL